MKKENPDLKVYLGLLKKPWLEHCKARGIKPGVALKEYVEQELEKAEALPKPKIFKQSHETADDERKERFEILLTKSEKAAIFKRAESEICSARRWVIDVIRLALTHEQQFGMKEIDVLGESNYQLLSIGRNLNQVAKMLNENNLVPITVEHIGKLSREIKKHTRKVADAQRASKERWDLK